MDYLAMKQAMINALQQQVVTLENNIKYLSNLNDDTVLVGNCLADSLKIITGFIEPSVEGGSHGKKYQFQRLGYFCIDPDSSKDNILINKTVGLKDTWSKSQNT